MLNSPNPFLRPLTAWSMSFVVLGAGAPALAAETCLTGTPASAVQALCSLHEGFARIQVGVRWGFVDKNDRLAIAPQFDEAGDFFDQRALVKKDGRYGYIDPQGRLAIPARFDAARAFSFGRASVTLGGKQGYIDAAGKWIVEPTYAEALPFFGPVALVREVDGTQALVDEAGQVVKRFPRDTVVLPANDFGFYPAEQGGLRGLIRADGEWILKPVSHPLPGTQGRPYIALGEGAELRVVDIRGRVSTAERPIGMAEDWPEWWWSRVEAGPGGDTVTVFSGIDFKERVRVPGKVPEGAKFTDGVLAFEPRQRTPQAHWTLINYTGKVLGSYPYEVIQPMRDNASVVGQRVPAGSDTWRYGYLHQQGKAITPLKFDAALAFAEERAVVREAGQLGWIDDLGRTKLQSGWACGDRTPVLADGKKRIVWPAEARQKKFCAT